MQTHTFENLELHSGNPATDAIEVVYEKYPIVLEPGKYINGRTQIDLEPTSELQDIALEAEVLVDLPELERIPAVLDLLRSRVDYPYPDTVEQLREDNAELAEWIRDKLLPEGTGGTKKLSEVFAKGFGVCNELSVAYLWLAQKAGLSGILLRSNHDQITNVNRAGSLTPLFKATPSGEKVPAHAWVEVKTEERGWVPVDPSTRYIGDTDEKLETFTKAGYDAHLYVVGLATVDNPDALQALTTILPVPPAADFVIASTKVALYGSRIKIGGDNNGESKPPKHQKYSGSAKVHFHDNDSHVGLKFNGIKKYPLLSPPNKIQERFLEES